MFYQQSKLGPAFGEAPNVQRQPVLDVGFLFIGGEHQMLHLAPVAAALHEATEGRCRARALVGRQTDERALRRILSGLGADIDVERLPAPWWARAAARLGLAKDDLKVPRLLKSRRRLRQFDALVAAERTSTLLKRLPGGCPTLIHIPHGAGDRARGFERRIRLFDHLIVAGEKDRRRMLAQGLVTPEQCSVSGYVKLSGVLSSCASTEQDRLFDNTRPVVLYNPHFSRKLGSWRRFARTLARTVLEECDHNLIIAPHARLAFGLRSADRAWLAELARNPRVIVDLGSSRSSDMSYTMAADVYVGDVSSQVYEYLDRPRPCVFLSEHRSNWSDDPNFAFWRFGEVVEEPADIAKALQRAADNHQHFREEQQTGVQEALGPYHRAGWRAASMVGHAASVRSSGMQTANRNCARLHSAPALLPPSGLWSMLGRL